MARFLKRHLVADTRVSEEMHHLLVDLYGAQFFDLRHSGSFYAKAGYHDLERSNLSYCCYSTPVSLQFRDDALVRVQLALNGTSRFSARSGSTDVTGAMVGCPPSGSLFEFGSHYEQLVFRVGRDVLERDIALLTGTRPKQALSFESSVPADLPGSMRFRQLLFSCVANIDLDEGPVPAPVIRELDQLLRVALLYGIPNSASSLLIDSRADAAPWQVRRVEEWVQANWRTEITLEKLVEVSGASARSIFATFRRARGVTPMEYVRGVRLEGARKMLLNATPKSTVTQVSLFCNFMNTSHFSRDYKKRFGELPSDTLSRGKRNMS